MPIFVDLMFKSLNSLYLNICLGAAGNRTNKTDSKQIPH